MSSNLSRTFKQELINFNQKSVIITTIDGKKATGILLGIRDEDLSLILSDCEINNEKYDRLMLRGNQIAFVTLGESPFDIFGLREELEKIFKRDSVRYYTETRTLVILDRYRVSEKGVEGPDGAVADRIKRVWSAFVKEGNSE